MFSNVQRVHPAWRFVMPFQSVGQFASYVAASMIGLLIVAWVVALVSHARVPAVAIAACFAGALPFVYATLPAKFAITTDGAADTAAWHERVCAKVAALGYRDLESSAGVTVLRAGKFLGLAQWRENALRVSSAGDCVTIVGPIFMIRVLRRMLVA